MYTRMYDMSCIVGKGSETEDSFSYQLPCPIRNQASSKRQAPHQDTWTESAAPKNQSHLGLPQSAETFCPPWTLAAACLAVDRGCCCVQGLKKSDPCCR